MRIARWSVLWPSEWSRETQQDWCWEFFVIGFRLAIVAIRIFGYCVDTRFYQLWHCCQVFVVRGKYLGCFLLSRVHSSLHKAAPNIHKCLSLERRHPLHLYSSFLLRPPIMGFMCPNIMDHAAPTVLGKLKKAQVTFWSLSSPWYIQRPALVPVGAIGWAYCSLAWLCAGNSVHTQMGYCGPVCLSLFSNQLWFWTVY